MVIGVLGTFVLDFLLSFAGPQDQYHLADAALASFSLVAQLWLGRKWLENWGLWILVNFSSIALFLDKEMWGYTVYFGVLGIMSVLGLIRGVKKKTLHGTLQTGVGKALV
jgi:nicotinamide riboside transporter PnuC